MPEPTEIMFGYRELVELMIKKQDLHEGIWSLSLRFGMKATNIGTSQESNDNIPTAMVGVLAIGLSRTDKENNLSIDAAKVNPRTGLAKPRPRH